MPNTNTRRTQIIEAIHNLKDLPTLPQVAQRVVALSQDSKTSYRDLKTVILSDPPLAAKVMNMANSAFFHRRSKAEKLEDAIFTIGLNSLVAICTSVGVMDVFNSWEAGKMDRRQLWRHSVATAFLSKSLELRKVLNKPDGPDIFLAGLLHDIGWIVFDKIVPQRLLAAIEANQDADIWSLEMEEEYIGMNHAECGALFLEKWNIPSAVIDLVANHHNPENSQQYPAHAGVVRISSLLVQQGFLFSLPFNKLPRFFPHHLKNPSSAQVLTEIHQRYEDYIKQADTIANLMTEWL